MAKSLDYREDQVFLSPGDPLPPIPVRPPQSQEAMGMDIKDYLRVLRTRKWWILFAIVLGVAASVGITLSMTPSYVAKATIFINVQSAGDSAFARGQYALQRADSYPQLIGDPTLLAAVARRVDADVSVNELRRALSATNPEDTVLIVITASAPQAQQAADLANAAAPLLAARIGELENSDPKSLLVTAEISVPASAPDDPVSPRKTVNLALGLVSGLSLGLVLALFVDKVDPRILRPADAERVTGLPVLGIVRGSDDRRERGRRDNGYRQLLSGLLLANDGDLPQRLLVLSDPKAPTVDAVELGQTLASMGRKAVVIQSREGAIEPGEVAEHPGLCQVLAGQATLTEALIEMIHVPMGYLAAGEPAAGLRRYDVFRRISPLIEELERSYDVVVILAAMGAQPIDGAVVAAHCDGVLLTTRQKKSTARSLRRTLEDLAAVRSGATGLVMLRHPRRRIRPRQG
ncbi:Wzz/FepE/Etk N-terminal domain-containing protein [Glutamicibacter sp. X7]